MAGMIDGLSITDEQLARDAYVESGIGNTFLGTAHTMRHYKTTNFMSELCDAAPFEQWSEQGAVDMQKRASESAKRVLAEYETPSMDEGINEALIDFVARKKASMEDAWY